MRRSPCRRRCVSTWRVVARARRRARAGVGRAARRPGPSRSPELAAERERDLAGVPRDGWLEALPVFPAGEAMATRDAGSKVMAALQPYTPTLIGGAADLVESTKTQFAGGGTFSAVHAGRNIAFGIREHAMGAIVNGLALEPALLKPYGSTFLIFSDYMRPAVRLSALMGLPSLWVWTHDSIGLGEDGPTHQPIEHHMALRAIPNLWYVRPAGRERDGHGVADRPRADGRTGRAGAHASEGADVRSFGGGAGRGHASRCVHALAARFRLAPRGDHAWRPAPRSPWRSRVRAGSTPTPGSCRCRAGSSSRCSRTSTGRRCCPWT